MVQIVIKFVWYLNVSRSSLLLFSIQSLFQWLYSGSSNKYCKLTVRAFHEQHDLITSSLSSFCFQLRKASLFRTTLKLLNHEHGWSQASRVTWAASRLRVTLPTDPAPHHACRRATALAPTGPQLLCLQAALCPGQAALCPGQAAPCPGQAAGMGAAHTDRMPGLSAWLVH